MSHLSTIKKWTSIKSLLQIMCWKCNNHKDIVWLVQILELVSHSTSTALWVMLSLNYKHQHVVPPWSSNYDLSFFNLVSIQWLMLPLCKKCHQHHQLIKFLCISQVNYYFTATCETLDAISDYTQLKALYASWSSWSILMNLNSQPYLLWLLCSVHELSTLPHMPSIYQPRI